MPNLNAALGCAQLEQMPAFLSSKRILAARYIEAFRDFTGIKFVVEPEFARSNYWLNALVLDEKFADQRDLLLEQTNQQGIMTRPVWVPDAPATDVPEVPAHGSWSRRES